MAHTRPLTRTNGLTPLEARYVLLKISDPNVPDHILAKRAGYKGTPDKLRETSARLNGRPQVIAALKAGKGLPAVTKDNVTGAINAILHDGNVLPSVKVSAARLLLETIPGGFVPLQHQHEGKFTLESLVDSMGGRPADVPRELPEGRTVPGKVTGREETPAHGLKEEMQ